MSLALIISVLTFFCIFILFLVLSRTLNNILNYLVKMEYLLRKEIDLRKERKIIEQLLEEEQKPDTTKEASLDKGAKDEKEKTQGFPNKSNKT
jgi:hypothetical protein